MLILHQHRCKGQEWNIKTCFMIVDSLLLWGSMKGITFQLSNYLTVPLKASGAQRFLSMAFAAFIDHMLNFHFSWFPLRQKFLHIDMRVMEEHHVRPSFVLSKSTGVNVCDMSRIGTRKTPYIFHALSKAGCSWSCGEMAPFYCAGQAHMWISLLNTKSISLLSLLVFAKQTLPRHQTLLFPTELTDLGEPKRGETSKLRRVGSSPRYQLTQVWSYFPVF